MSELNPNAKSFEFNAGADEFVPSFSPATYPPPRVIHPAIYSYTANPSVQFTFRFPPRFYVWNDGYFYLKDGQGQKFGPFSDEDLQHFYETHLADKHIDTEDEKTKEKEKEKEEKPESNEISFSDFMKLQEARLKSQGPKLGYRQVAVTGTDRVSIDQVLEEEKLPQKPKPEKPKIRLVPEKPIDKYLLITKLRENPDSSLDISLKEPDHDQHPVNIVFIGHVDAGKSTICGNILLLTGKIDRRTIESYEQDAKDKGRESWWLAYVMDQNEEERQKGINVEVGRAFFETPSSASLFLTPRAQVLRTQHDHWGLTGGLRGPRHFCKNLRVRDWI